MKTLDIIRRESFNFDIRNRNCALNRDDSNMSNGAKIYLLSRMKELDQICLTLQRQIQLINNSNHQFSIQSQPLYSGDPDSLDGTSSDLITDETQNENLTEDDKRVFLIGENKKSPKNGYYNNVNHFLRRSTNPQLYLEDPYPITFLNLRENEPKKSGNQFEELKKKIDGTRDDLDSGEGMSETTSLLFQHHRDFSTVDPIENITNEIDFTNVSSILDKMEKVKEELISQNVMLKMKMKELSSRTFLIHSDPINNNNSQNKKLETLENLPKLETKRKSNLSSLLISSPISSVDELEKNLLISNEELKLRRKFTYKINHNHSSSKENEELNGFKILVGQLQLKIEKYEKNTGELEEKIEKLQKNLSDEIFKKHESKMKVFGLEKALEAGIKKLETVQVSFLNKNEEASTLQIHVETLQHENRTLKEKVNFLHLEMETQQWKNDEKLSLVEKKLDKLKEENDFLEEELGHERFLRKTYFNLVEELKGKIRVYCRIRPGITSSKSDQINELVVHPLDKFTLTVHTNKGSKDFIFDRVFGPQDSQETVFQDTRSLIQSAFDGYNVCCLTYGQTGSGKTFTILGDENFPGIAPRTFNEIFNLAAQIKQTHHTKITYYCVELYNDKLIDLLNLTGSNYTDSSDSNKLEIRRDRCGTVWISGAQILEANSSNSIEQKIREALGSRHTGNTKMNDRSSRSHLIIGINILTISNVTGSLLRGKISLLDLAGSERTSKSGVNGDSLREANYINKSLSALGDVINALNSDQTFVPYRNNKLTLLLQDSIGGNAKTLMFVNVSPSIRNVDETLVCLSYALRIKEVTNKATRNNESKEISRLRHVINRLKRGEICTFDEE